MVKFALVSREKVPTIKHSSPIKSKKKSYDVLDELMNLRPPTNNKYDKVKDNSLDTSSFNLQEIIKDISIKNIDYRDALINSLYAQVEYLREDALIKNDVIKQLINKIHTADCTAKTSPLIDTIKIDDTHVGTKREIVNYASGIIENDDAEKVFITNEDYFYNDDSDDENEINHESSFSDFDKKIPRKFRYTLSSTAVSTPTKATINTSSSSASSSDDGRHKFSERYQWEKHSSGVASRILDKMGYKGKGLGKEENGITEAITTDKLGKIDTSKKTTIGKRKLLYILSSSMLNRMDGERLCNKEVEVKVQCHGGCTIRCLYSHLPHVINSKPDFILLHMGSNDCSNKTSDEVLKELTNLINHLKLLLPCCTVILSAPIVRSDNNTAAAVQKNLNVKIRKLLFPYLDNSNIGYDHLGKKGLHLNDHGTKKMARNIISLVKRL